MRLAIREIPFNFPGSHVRDLNAHIGTTLPAVD